MKPLKFILLGFAALALFIVLTLNPKSSLAQDCASEAPTDAPNLYQVSASSSSATLYFVQPNSKFDGYSISYGLTQSADAYSTTFSMGVSDGAVKYTVNDLFPQTNYFFKVRANNGCASGPWSSTVSTSIKGASSLPVTGPQNTILGLGIGGIALTLIGVFVLLFTL